MNVGKVKGGQFEAVDKFGEKCDSRALYGLLKSPLIAVCLYEAGGHAGKEENVYL